MLFSIDSPGGHGGNKLSAGTTGERIRQDSETTQVSYHLRAFSQCLIYKQMSENLNNPHADLLSIHSNLCCITVNAVART